MPLRCHPLSWDVEAETIQLGLEGARRVIGDRLYTLAVSRI